MTRKQIAKVSDKLKKVDESFTITVHDNGFLIDVSGRDQKDDWAGAKIQVATIEGLLKLIEEVVEMERS